MPNDQAHDTRVTDPLLRLAAPVQASVAAVASGGGGGSGPSISSFTGTFAQGNTISLTGSFSAERNGQVDYIVGDPGQLGTIDSGIVGLSGETTGTGYTHDNTRSFGKSGVSLLADFAGANGVTRSCIRLPARSRKLFISAQIYADLSSWDGTEVGPQVKFMRLLSVDGLHNGDVEVSLHLSSYDSRTNPGMRMDGWGGSSAAQFPDPDYGSDWARNSVRDEADRNWNRFTLYAQLPDPISGTNGRRFARILEHFANRQIPVDQTYTDPSLLNGQYSWLAPEEIAYPQAVSESFTQTEFLMATLPFYQLGIPNLKVWADCIYVNDTPERVEFGDAPVMDDCTKLVVQKQLSRTATGIDVEVEEGNFTASDNVYAFVVNSDTQYTAGALIRAAV